ncbi:hypothetical protein CMEL01_08886, partial [Colletotrichum melonis]
MNDLSPELLRETRPLSYHEESRRPTLYLTRRFPRGTQTTQCTTLPRMSPEPSPSPSSDESQQPTQPTVEQFNNVLQLVMRVVGTNERLTTSLIQQHEQSRLWQETWGSQTSPPPYSPPRQNPPSSPSSFQTAASQRTQSNKSSSPPLDETPNPPIPGDPEPTANALFNRVNTFAKANGFGIVKRHKYTSRTGRLMRYLFQCDRFGEPGPSKGAGIRQRRSRKCGCQWQVIAEAQEEGKWLLRYHSDPQHSRHNHGPSLGASAHPSHRKLTRPVKDAIETTSRRVGIRARDIRAIVQEQFPEASFTQRDIYNARARINREKLNGYSPTAALIKLFDERGIPYIVKWAADEPNRLVGLVWTFPYCLQMWKRFPEVISFDNTYNTNRFKLPLFQATGQTCLGSIYNAAFGLIDNERLEGFQFLSAS